MSGGSSTERSGVSDSDSFLCSLLVLFTSSLQSHTLNSCFAGKSKTNKNWLKAITVVLSLGSLCSSDAVGFFHPPCNGIKTDEIVF